MNPFNWAGPEFLVFYVVFAGALIIAAAVYWHIRTSRADVPVLTNPYEIAYLRGGPSEAIRVAVIGLMERNVLEADELRVVRTIEGYEAAVNDPFERKIVDHFRTRGAASTAPKNDSLTELLRPVKEKLEREGLVPNEELDALRMLLIGGVLSLLWIVALTKIAIALDRGKGNVGFLIFLVIIATVMGVSGMLARGSTAAGDVAIERLQCLHRSEIGLIPSGSELLMYAAVYGAAAAPVVANPYERRPGDTGGGSGCGSGGDGCGGGGGCGGCGGGGD